MTVCPKHRDAYGTRWRAGKTRCCVPAEVAGHKSTNCRGDRGIDRKQSCFVFKETGMLVPVGSRKCSQTLPYFSRNPGGYSHTLPIQVCAAQRGRDFEAPDLERGIHFRGVF